MRARLGVSEGMETWTLVVALLGLVAALCSLAWQAWTFMASGARVAAVLMVGGARGRTWGTAPLKDGWQRGVRDFELQGCTPVLGVTATNTGRQAATIRGFGTWADTRTDEFGTLGATLGQRLRHRLEANDEETWFLPFTEITEFLDLLPFEPTRIGMEIYLGNGKTVRAPESLLVAELAPWRNRPDGEAGG